MDEKKIFCLKAVIGEKKLDLFGSAKWMKINLDCYQEAIVDEKYCIFIRRLYWMKNLGSFCQRL